MICARMGGWMSSILHDDPISTDILRVDAVIPTKDLFDALQIYVNYPPIAFRP